MKTVLRKIRIILLAIIVVFGAMPIINEVSFQHTTNNQYVLSRYFPNGNSIHSPQNNITTVGLPANTEESTNWAGYITTPTTNSGYTSISGSWTVPNISASQRNAVAAQWIGLGGVNSKDLLQMGTIEQMENGQPMAEVFWEQLPAAAQNVISIPIGSTVNVSISESTSSSSTWNLTFTVNSPDKQTQTQTISTTLDSSYAGGIGTSAEWISEDPSNLNGQLVPLANMGTVKYQSAIIDGQPLNASGNKVQPVAMVSSNKTILIAPSKLGVDGESFTTTVTNSTDGHRVKVFPKPIWRRIDNSFGLSW